MSRGLGHLWAALRAALMGFGVSILVAIPLAIIGAVVAEFVAAQEGLGYFIQFSTSFFKFPQAFAGFIFLAAVSLLLFKSVQWTQQIFFAWSLPKKNESRQLSCGDYSCPTRTIISATCA